MEIELDIDTQKKLRNLQGNEYEVNGRVSFEHGKVTELTHRKGQWMEPCLTGCAVNFHTHPPDYDTLYPDHPSITDYHYIYNATCSFKELGAHMIFTPKFIYVIWYNCEYNLLKEFSKKINIYKKMDNAFESLPEDRSSEEFRLAYINKMQQMGFVIFRYRWFDEIKLRIPLRKKYSSLYYKLTYIVCSTGLIMYLSPRNKIAFIIFVLFMIGRKRFSFI